MLAVKPEISFQLLMKVASAAEKASYARATLNPEGKPHVGSKRLAWEQSSGAIYRRFGFGGILQRQGGQTLLKTTYFRWGITPIRLEPKVFLEYCQHFTSGDGEALQRSLAACRQQKGVALPWQLGPTFTRPFMPGPGHPD